MSKTDTVIWFWRVLLVGGIHLDDPQSIAQVLDTKEIAKGEIFEKKMYRSFGKACTWKNSSQEDGTA